MLLRERSHTVSAVDARMRSATAPAPPAPSAAPARPFAPTPDECEAVRRVAHLWWDTAGDRRARQRTPIEQRVHSIIWLLDGGQDINEVCEPGGSSGLYVASRTNNVRMAEMLLKK